jgi:hypothetical protein
MKTKDAFWDFTGTLYEITPEGKTIVLASGPDLDYRASQSWFKSPVDGLAFDRGGSLLVASDNIYRYNPDGKRQIFAEGGYNSIAFQSPIPEPSVTASILVIGIVGGLVFGSRRIDSAEAGWTLPI